MQMSMVHGAEIQKAVNALWTVQDVCDAYGVTPMAVHLWRTERKMPAVVIEGNKRPAVRFVPKEVKDWAKNQGISPKGPAATAAA